MRPWSSILIVSALALPAPAAAQRELDSALSARFSADAPGAALLVARDGKVVYQGARGSAQLLPARSLGLGTPIYIASLTKTFTGVGIVRLAERGKLRLDDRAELYLPELRGVLQGATLRQILTHTSGLPDHLAGRADSVAGWTNREVIAFLLGHPSTTAPGSAVRYSNSGYILLATVIERVAGLSYPEFVRREFLLPLGMTRTGVITRDHPAPTDLALGYREVEGAWRQIPYEAFTYGAGGMYSTVEDLLKWGEGVRTGRVVSDSMMPQVRTAPTLTNGRPTAYGLGWLAEWDASGPLANVPYLAATGGLGGYQTLIKVIPDRGVVVIAVANGGVLPWDLVQLAHRLYID